MLGIMSAASTEALYLEEILSDVVQDSKVARVLMEICREGESDGWMSCSIPTAQGIGKSIVMTWNVSHVNFKARTRD